MGRLHAKYFKVAVAGGDLDAATERELAKNEINLKGTDHVVEHITHDHPEPKERYGIGSGYEIKGVMVYDDDNDLVDMFGGTLTANVYTKVQGIRTLPMKDIRFGVYRKDGLIVLYDFTDMNFMPEFEAQFAQNNRTYLPFTLKSTKTTDFTVDNMAA